MLRTKLFGQFAPACPSTSQRVTSLFRHGQITYDLLWALFKPGYLVYSTCLGTGKPRCVIFDAGEETIYSGVIYYKLDYRHLDFDGQDFGEARIAFGIEKFRGAKAIDSLEAFPLRYHSDSELVRQQLVEGGRKCCALTSTHIQHCKGTAFIMSKGKPVQININSRVAVDAAIFREMRPNYSRPRVQDIWQNQTRAIKVIDVDYIFDGDQISERENMRQKDGEFQQMTDYDFLICCPTVRCLGFKEKTFLKCVVSDLMTLSGPQNHSNASKFLKKQTSNPVTGNNPLEPHPDSAI
ncbi:hypothetical protein CNMCM5793_005497 [Aspergillus hiratsukae]|uniref:DUF7025 domain-containing protein n=1 Tax=Aspergillus hiratsukae TaxID=1194566 RepID=A0A8H6PG67_9EURO|nr:hypothetical protein CNMCM5793_005497 [Aspergillus hiratsukae]KAF7172296.1 hypothetical protein CNMCM6106_006551 [Aspergillus hiratsukae]